VPRLLAGKSTQAILGVKTEYPSYRLDGELGYRRARSSPTSSTATARPRPACGRSKVRATQRGGAIEQYGDVIVAIDGKAVRSFDELPRVLGNRKPGDTVKVTVVRGLPDAPQAIELPIQLTAQNEGLKSGM
jgi:S1-C subfamily serine protease